jgi:hypothetical protein
MYPSPGPGVGGKGSPSVTVRSSPVLPPHGPTRSYWPDFGAGSPGLSGLAIAQPPFRELGEVPPLWEQFCALLPERGPYHPDHPLGCHRRRVDDRVIFDRLVQVLVFGCGYRKIAEQACSATTIRDRP